MFFLHKHATHNAHESHPSVDLLTHPKHIPRSCWVSTRKGYNLKKCILIHYYNKTNLAHTPKTRTTSPRVLNLTI